uniref:Transposable element Hobo transposase n=1 Tax=Bactrocera dorsalis TaxID=27457 RepID=A0A034VXM0_BACDO
MDQESILKKIEDGVYELSQKRISMDYRDSVLQKIENGVYVLSQKRKGKSKTWNVFAEIIKEDGTILDGFVCCRKCFRLYIYKGQSTSNLNRHKCFKPQPEEATIIDEAPVTVDNDLEEDVKDCPKFFSVFTPDEPQITETSPHQPPLCNNDTIADNAVEKQNTPKRKLDHTKQLDSLCEMVKIDLQDVSDEVFFEAKWKILDVLREVHQKKLK